MLDPIFTYFEYKYRGLNNSSENYSTNNYIWRQNEALNQFLDYCKTLEKPRVLELGTKRSIPTRSTKHNYWVPNAGEYLGSDIEKDIDVDIVADVHQLTKVTGEEQFDIIISCSSFEHFKYPHIAALEIMKALKIGGALFVHTHHTFPLHAYPFDYFRFSCDALKSLFGTNMGFTIRSTNYDEPAYIFSKWDKNAYKYPAFLYVALFGVKESQTPDQYIYEYDVKI